ncbi:MAG TPA: RagB/SusD family nutrient uptake outer membrane protein [Puia sp.]|nr:RagB/SusD family nutrient uptake outer membrane protein [Puia sp.]
MNKKILIVTAVLYGLVMLSSCKKYLDVKPDDKFLESQLFSSKVGIESVLNSIYLQLPNSPLYGENLSTTAVELFAQQYNYSASAYSAFSYYNFNDPSVVPVIDTIWSSSYNTIVNINKLIANLAVYPGVVSKAESDIIAGEAYALRAMLHFDLLRLYGPVYSTHPQVSAIPYYTVATPDAQPFLNAADVMVKILADLHTAEGLLAADPIITLGKQEVLQNDGNDFLRFRNLRMNFYAVKALEARVQLYAGNNAAALAAAQNVINSGAALFPWSDPVAVNAGGNSDKVFSSEIVFALQNLNMYSQFDATFVSANSVLAPSDFRLQETYEVQTGEGVNDYRYRSQWGGVLYGIMRQFLKYTDVTDQTKTFRYMQPMLRMSEMYYIAAESETDPALALGYLNTVRYNRGLSNLPDGTDINAELLKEYRKEFYGEGQLFFYYKRTNASMIPDGSGMDDYSFQYMRDSYYVVPHPQY